MVTCSRTVRDLVTRQHNMLSRIALASYQNDTVQISTVLIFYFSVLENVSGMVSIVILLKSPHTKENRTGASPYLQHIVAQTPVMETTRARGLCMVGVLSSTPTTHKYTDTEDAYAGSMSIDIHVK